VVERLCQSAMKSPKRHHLKQSDSHDFPSASSTMTELQGKDGCFGNGAIPPIQLQHKGQTNRNFL
jgi:hypothetical protein